MTENEKDVNKNDKENVTIKRLNKENFSAEELDKIKKFLSQFNMNECEGD